MFDALLKVDRSETLVSNVHGTWRQFHSAHTSLTTFLADPAPATAFVASVQTLLGMYPLEELRARPQMRSWLPLLWGNHEILNLLGFDPAVFINECLLSTNPTPSHLSAPQWEELLLQIHQLERCVVWRGLREHRDAVVMGVLRSYGYKLIPSRLVYIFEGKNKDLEKKGDLKKDYSLAAKNSLTLVEGLEPADLPRVRELYEAVYLEKHSRLNPDLTEQCFSLFSAHPEFRFFGLRDASSRLVAFALPHLSGEGFSCSILGYDTKAPAKMGLYRAIQAVLLKWAVTSGLVYDMSSGADMYKRYRGARPEVDWIAIRPKRWEQKAYVHVIASAMQKFGIPLYERTFKNSQEVSVA